MNDQTDADSTLARDSALAATLQNVIEGLGAHTGLAHLLAEDDHTLRTAIIAGAQPAIYTMPERLDINAPYATATAFRTGQPTTAGFLAPHSTGGLELASRVPFPYSVLAVPLDTDNGRLGVLALLWIPPRSHPLDPGQTAWLTDQTERLARTLRGLAPTVSMRAGTKPVLLPIYNSRPPATGANTGWGLPHIPGSTEVSFMYQVHQLAAELNEAAGVNEVMAVTRNRIMAPFDAQAFLVSTLRDGRLWVAGHSGYPTVALRLLHGAAAGPHRADAHALLTETPLFIPDRATLTDSYPSAVDDDLEASAHLPLTLSGRPIGVCTLGFTHPRTFSAEERAVAMMMMDLLGPALQRATLDENARSLAENLQKKLLPRDLVEVPGMTTTARYVPAPSTAGLGGDWYDMIPLPGGRLALVVGDVEGHSIESSVVMGQLRSAVRAYTTEGHAPDVVMARANRLLHSLDTDLMATCCLVALDIPTGNAEAVLAGHPAPLLQTHNNTLHTTHLPPNIPLGITPNALYQTGEITLNPDTLLILHTNGLIPPTVTPHTPTPEDPGTLEKLADHLVDNTTTHPDHNDDIALLLAHYEGPTPGPNRRISHRTFQRHDLQAVKAARQFITDSLHTWGLDQMIDNFQLLTSEIVTNALIHADSDVDLRLREYPDHLRLEVHDTDPTPPIPTTTDTPRANQHAEHSRSLTITEHGRGLTIVDHLSTQWGNTPTTHGKTIWVDIYNDT
ncbi:SpoIIE family protein phosphatase [Streptomyces sp. NPDC004561]